MPKEHESRREILDAIHLIPSLSELLAMQEGHYISELDLEIVVYGRNYNGKKVGPYVRLLTYSPEEIVLNQGEWGANAFYFVVEGTAEVFVTQPDGKIKKVSEIFRGLQFGERAVLAGMQRNATVKASKNEPLRVLEIQRPAIRLLRKLPKVSAVLDRSYRTYAKRTFLDGLRSQGHLSESAREGLEKISRFRVLSKHHLLFNENSPIESLYFIKEGWFRRTRIPVEGGSAVCRQCEKLSQQNELFCSNCGSKLVEEEFQGKGFCFGTEGLLQKSQWSFTVQLMGRTELLEIPLMKLEEYPEIRSFLTQNWSRFSPPPFASRKSSEPSVEKKVSAAQEKLIQTGLVDGTNLLVMDMDLCVRCGNCSLACHKVHGQSRLIREGIHVSRLRKGRSGGNQSVLAPAVCLHCKDPECLSGCPTGAISRKEEGQIDIHAKTCIGCGDCAAQCPYHAISLISRKKAPAAPSLNWKDKMKDLLRIRLDPLPPAVDQSDDLVAVKCNLCANTPLNPPGKDRPAYSCELNCPTGALARIHPETYFKEIGEIEGLKFLDQTHAIGRNIHVADPPKRWIHAGSVLFSVLLTALILYGIQRYGLGGKIISFLNMRWVTGLVGLVVMTLVMLYPFRRQIYKRRAAPLRYWMLIHGYSGVLTAIVFVIHGGSDSGGLLTTALMISFNLVILTGLFGIIAYIVIPRILTSIEEEPLLLDSLIQKRNELQSELAQVLSTSGKELKLLIIDHVIPQFTSLSYLLSQYINKESLDRMLIQASAKFDKQREKLARIDQENLAAAIECVATMRRLDALIYLHQVLKIWLPPHVISTSLMLALMFVHIAQVIFFLWR